MQPRIEVTSNSFKLILPNMDNSKITAREPSEAPELSNVTITPQMKTILDYLYEYGEITDEEIQELLNIKRARSYLLSRHMNEIGLIETIGRGHTKKYKLK